jgi:DNA-binding GntR family transcriptional regulator
MVGLVQIIPNIGTFVEEVIFQHLKALFEIRAHFPALAGSLAAASISLE